MADISHEEFVTNAIRNLRTGESLGIHVSWSGFNDAFREHFKEEPRPVVDKMIEDGILASRPTRGGIIIYLAEEAPESVKETRQPKDVLGTILNGGG